MKKEIKRVSLFNSSMFGNVRTIENENGEAMFCLNDVCKCLGIEKPSNIINDLKKSIINSIECSKSNSLLNKLLPDYQQVTDEKQSLLNTLKTVFGIFILMKTLNKARTLITPPIIHRRVKSAVL